MKKTTTRDIFGAAAGLLLAGCGAVPVDRNPSISNMTLDPLTMPEAARVWVPMPEAEPVRALHRAEAASLWLHGSDGFFSDQRATRVGDILTIDIQIDDQAQLSNATARNRDGSASIGFPSFFGYGSQIDKVLPGVSASDLPSGDIMDIDSSTQAGGSGSIDRAETISLKVAATIVRKLPNGNLVVAGRQEVMVNSELRELRVAGIIRPQDIERDNVISYDKIAEARITYAGRGQLSRQTRPSRSEGALDIILPY